METLLHSTDSCPAYTPTMEHRIPANSIASPSSPTAVKNLLPGHQYCRANTKHTRHIETEAVLAHHHSLIAEPLHLLFCCLVSVMSSLTKDSDELAQCFGCAVLAVPWYSVTEKPVKKPQCFHDVHKVYTLQILSFGGGTPCRAAMCGR